MSLNWLRTFIQLDKTPEELSELLTDLGLEVAGIEHKSSIEGNLEGIVVGKVLECGKHPNADRLSLTKVDVGADQPIQIVCGAPNVAKGQTVPVAMVGSTLYPTDGEPFAIKKGKIRGEVSQGMICAEDEIGVGTDHDGIIVLDNKWPAGTKASEVFDIKSDVVYDIDLTPNRSDATNHIGVAKDLLAALVIREDQAQQFNAKPLATFTGVNNLTIEVELIDSEKCPRFTGIVLKDITVGPSPEWLQWQLEAIGVRPINNVVDITNYVLHEYGQPLHAYDYDKIANAKIRVKTLEEGAPFQSLDEQNRKLSSDDLMICDGEDIPMCIGGVFGGLESGVTENTTRIFLEAAHFEAKGIRRSSHRHLLFTDASKVFEKGSDPNVCEEAIQRAVYLLEEFAEAKQASPFIDKYPSKILPVQIPLRYPRVTSFIGQEIPPLTISRILEALEMEIRSVEGSGCEVLVPTNKADVTREIDLIEEVLRIYGFNRIALPNKMVAGSDIGNGQNSFALRNTVAGILQGVGYNECMSMSLVSNAYFPDPIDITNNALVFINNTSNAAQEIMRPTMVISALENVRHNLNRQQHQIKIFEFGSTYHREVSGYKEIEKLSLTFCGTINNASWTSEKSTYDPYFHLKGVVIRLLEAMRINSSIVSELVSNPFLSYGQEWKFEKKAIAKLGRIKSDICNAFDIKQAVYHAEFEWNALIEAWSKAVINVSSPGKYPRVKRDLALVIPASVTFDEIEAIVLKQGKGIVKKVDLFDLYQDEQMKADNKRQYALSLQLEHSEKTLSEKDINKIIDKMMRSLENQFGITLR